MIGTAIICAGLLISDAVNHALFVDTRLATVAIVVFFMVTDAIAIYARKP